MSNFNSERRERLAPLLYLDHSSNARSAVWNQAYLRLGFDKQYSDIMPQSDMSGRASEHAVNRADEQAEVTLRKVEKQQFIAEPDAKDGRVVLEGTHLIYNNEARNKLRGISGITGTKRPRTSTGSEADLQKGKGKTFPSGPPSPVQKPAPKRVKFTEGEVNAKDIPSPHTRREVQVEIESSDPSSKPAQSGTVSSLIAEVGEQGSANEGSGSESGTDGSEYQASSDDDESGDDDGDEVEDQDSDEEYKGMLSFMSLFFLAQHRCSWSEIEGEKTPKEESRKELRVG